MKRFIWALALAVSPTMAAGQVTIGTDPSAHTALWSREPIAIGIRQTFLAPAPSMTSLSLWVDLGQIPPQGAEQWFATVYIFPGSDIYRRPETLYRYELLPSDRGELQLAFAQPLSMITGNPYFFEIFFNNCGHTGEIEEGVCPVAVGPTYLPPSVRFTTTNAYNGGVMFSDYDLEPDADVWFRATFDVPETEPLTLTASVAVALLVLGASRRRRTRG